MPNQLNFGNPFVDFTAERMYRISVKDQRLLLEGEKTILFGTSDFNNVEIWFYFPNGGLAGSIRLPVTDSDIELMTTVDNTGAYEYVSFNLESIAERTPLNPGRYVAIMYFFRDEVSSKTSDNKLLIKEISPSRTEVRLSPETRTQEIADQIKEFVIPSVPRLFAKGLIDQMFNKSLDAQEGEFISPEFNLNSGSLLTQLELENGIPPQGNSISERIERAEAVSSYENLMTELIDRTYFYSILSLSNDYTNWSIQETEIKKYISDALLKALTELEENWLVDPRFNLLFNKPPDSSASGTIEEILLQ